MYKVLIVDDEPMIREGLTSIIEWEKYGYTVAGTAANGQEAIQKHAELQPSLILIDIRMPGMDGLEAIRRIRANDSVCHILILSGYADFSYAKKAISLQVDGYLLKPIDEDELEAYAKKIAAQLAVRSDDDQTSLHTANIIREELLERIAKGKLEHGGSDLSRLAELLGPSARTYQLLLLELYSREHSLTRNAVVKQKLAREIEEKGQGWVFSSEPYIGILLIDYTLAPHAIVQMKAMIAASITDKARFIGAASAPVRELHMLEQWSPVLRGKLKRRFMLEGNAIYMAELPAMNSMDKESEESRELDIHKLAQALYFRIDIGNADGLKEIVQQASHAIAQYDNQEQSIKSNWAQLLTFVLNKASVANPSVSLQDDLSIITGLYLTHHYEEMLEQLQHRLLGLANKLRGTDSHSTMKQITDFIERHYAENLKLETLSEMFNYNSGYLGKMFKSFTGESFNTYLDQVRIKHAVELLQEGMKVHQVSSRVGYANVDYFHSKFKKYKGASPSSFKGSSDKDHK